MARDRLRGMLTSKRVAVMLALVVTLVFLGVGLLPQKASAMPAFARKYQTSCATCHVSIPALTPFGEAFRLNGYRFPEGQDEAMTKDTPVNMGAEGYKKLWPNSLWPGQIPGMPPVGVLIENAMEWDNTENVFTLAGMGGEMEVLAAGTLDEHLSFWAGFEFAREPGGEVETELARVFFQIRPLSSAALQFRVGAFEPGLMLVSNHRRLMDQPYLALAAPAGDNPWTAEPVQQGIEAFGVVQHRVLYSAGVLEGSGSVGDKSKDVYGRLGYKFGGLAFDGVSTDANAGAANPKPWSETSIAVSAFAYHGKSLLPNDMGPMPEDEFDLFGGDVAVTWLDATARGGYTDRKDDRLLLSDSTLTDAHVKNLFAELSWVVYPWLVPGARYQSVKEVDETTHRLSFTINALVRANVKTFLVADWVKEPDGDFTNEGAELGVLIGF